MTKKVLIADDEAHIRFLIQQSLADLEEDDVELISAINGQEALDMIEKEKPALVFLDAMMPHVSGFDICQKVREDLGMEDTYIVIVTARGQAFDKERSLQMGANEHRTKPFDPDDLLELASKVLDIR